MLEQKNIIRLLSILSYFGFVISAITGFIELNKDFTLCMIMTSIVLIISTITIGYLDIKNKFILNPAIHIFFPVVGYSR